MRNTASSQQATNSQHTISGYIEAFSPAVQEKLQQLRQTIAQAAPHATEAIKYAMPTFVFHGNLVHFAAYVSHIGFYPTPSAIVAFSSELKKYATSKGAVQFPIDEPLPLELISAIVRFRVTEVEQKINTKH